MILKDENFENVNIKKIGVKAVEIKQFLYCAF